MKIANTVEEKKGLELSPLFFYSIFAKNFQHMYSIWLNLYVFRLSCHNQAMLAPSWGQRQVWTSSPAQPVMKAG